MRNWLYRLNKRYDGLDDDLRFYLLIDILATVASADILCFLGGLRIGGFIFFVTLVSILLPRVLYIEGCLKPSK